MKKYSLIAIALLAALFILPVSAASPATVGAMMREADKQLAAGLPAKALALYSRAAEQAQGALIKMTALGGKGDALSRLGRYGESVDAYKKAIYTSLTVDDEGAHTARLRFNLAKLLTDIGRYEEAETELFLSMGRLYEDVPLELAVLRSEIYTRQGYLDLALEVLDKEIEKDKKSPSADRRMVAIALQNRAFVNYEQRNYESALADFNAALGDLKDEDYYNTLANRAMAESMLGSHSAAISDIGKAVSGLKKFKSNSDAYTVALRKQAEILYNAGKKVESRKTFEKYFELEKATLKRDLPTMSAKLKLDYWTKLKPRLSRCFILGGDNADFLFDVALYRRAVSMLAMRDSARLEKAVSARSSDIRKALPERSVMIELVRHPNAGGDMRYSAIILPKVGKAKMVDIFPESFVNYSDEENPYSLYDKLSGGLHEEITEVYTDSLLAAKIWNPIFRAVPASTENIYFVPDGIFHLLAIENLPYPALEKTRVRRLSLSTRILDKKPQGGISTPMLLVGGLDYDEPAPGDFEANEEEMLSRSGGGLLSALADHSAYSELESAMRCTGCRFFTYLQGTRTEADSISRLIPEATRSYKISEERLKQQLGHNRMAHIATHGYAISSGMADRPYFLSDSVAVDLSMLRSGIALTGANTMAAAAPYRDDGVLSAREICELNLDSLDFVVLSACQTALGSVNDEGPAGLVRALKMAGAGTVMASLWAVNDRSTALLMTEFYRALAAGNSPHDALKIARKSVAETPSYYFFRKFSPARMARERAITVGSLPPLRDPYYWAAFILIDDI